jgi:hypothetical protein
MHAQDPYDHLRESADEGGVVATCDQCGESTDHKHEETEMLTVIVKEPGKDPEVRHINGTVEEIQRLVGGYFEAHSMYMATGAPLTVFCNEGGFGQNKYMAPNIMDACHAAVLVGTVVVMRGDYGLYDYQVAPTLARLKTRSVAGSPV